ncbi:MAG TPA: hypothetical protein VKV37_11180 [Ktedonobacteraceae bacterium]|jgi:hypothetical protein|nr:hypothetical protein [Ktedonobacteraceae bacterium]
MKKKAPIAVPMEDELVHTDARPICDDLTCPCHENATPAQPGTSLERYGMPTPEAIAEFLVGKGSLPYTPYDLLAGWYTTRRKGGKS